MEKVKMHYRRKTGTVGVLIALLLLAALPGVSHAQLLRPWTLQVGTTGGEENTMLPHYDAALTRCFRLLPGIPAHVGLNALLATDEMETDYGVLMTDAEPDVYRLKGGVGLFTSLTPLHGRLLSLHLEMATSYALVEVTETSGGFVQFPSDITVSIGTVSTLLLEAAATLEFQPIPQFGIAASVGQQRPYYEGTRFANFTRGTIRFHF